MQDFFKDKGVTFVGVTEEDKALVTRFLEGGWDKKMRYTVAIDDKGKTNKAWMRAAEQQGIPCAFVVNGGKIKWIGHPMDDAFGDTIAKLAGDEKGWEKFAEKQKAEEKHKEEVLAKVRNAVTNEEWQKAFDAMGELLQINPDDFAAEFGRYHLLQVKMDKKKDAAKYGRELVGRTEDATNLNMMAHIAEVDKVDPATLKRAMAYGACVASVTIEDFSLAALRAADRDTVQKRFEEYRKMLSFD